ncbi:RagB/SusD family nutrient uptake outer membrane protein [Dyadobacter luteus]|uniref:RagB/SusD family nutrient uptake outer membrane protein n=1 Tax=Dyadobacter luteus TaxID=2259619 RepID=A0A3D8YHM7_9BACT|nr:RagB/SusD family nutrient uptake outer membrane protein [Dyadobacter luteus]REA62829.1 RagB/SusD family nutrient uptake outer membrane protein [Dyadobacter luteus]
MKKTYITGKAFKRTLLWSSFSIAVLSCHSNILDLQPQTSISEQTAFSTPAKILSQVNGLYSQLGAESFYGGRYIIFSEQRGNEFSQNDGNNSTGANVWNQSITGSGDFVNAVWSAAYRTINSANTLIDKLSEDISVIDQPTKNAYIAEAKFIRALSYFSLVQTYAKPYTQSSSAVGLPLRLKGETSGGNNDLAFSTVAQVYEQILKDLDQAETDLPATYSTALLNSSRAHKASAIALKTRVNLVKADYAAVAAEAAKIVSAAAPFQYVSASLTHKLEADISSVFTGSYTGSESIFTIPFLLPAEAPGLQSSLASNYLTPVIYLNTAAIVSDPVFGAESKDARKGLLTTNATGQNLLRKFSKNSAPFTTYIPVIRYAEILLNYAEAAAQNNDLEKATALLQAVRNRSDASHRFSTGVATKTELVATIQKERRIELLGEGFRSHDLFRTGQPLPAKVGNAGTAPAIAPTAANYVWPVPSNELAYNKLAPR